MTYHEMVASIRETQARLAREKERGTWSWPQHMEVSPWRLGFDERVFGPRDTVTGLAGARINTGDVVYRASDGKFHTYLGFDLNTNTNNQQQGDNAMNTKKVVCECEVVEEVPEFRNAAIYPTANGYKVVITGGTDIVRSDTQEYSYESLDSALAGLGHAIEEFDQEQDKEG